MSRHPGTIKTAYKPWELSKDQLHITTWGEYRNHACTGAQVTENMRPTHIQIREFLDQKHPLLTLPMSHCRHHGKRLAPTNTFKESILVENDPKWQNRVFSSTHQNDDFHWCSN